MSHLEILYLALIMVVSNNGQGLFYRALGIPILDDCESGRDCFDQIICPTFLIRSPGWTFHSLALVNISLVNEDGRLGWDWMVRGPQRLVVWRLVAGGGEFGGLIDGFGLGGFIESRGRVWA